MNGVQKGDHVSGATLSGAEVRRQRNRQEMRNAILEEASRIVAEDGLEALSIRAIARNLGYSAGALYEYFRDKDAIIHGLYFKGADGVGAAMERGLSALPDDVDVLEELRTLARIYRAHALANPDLFRLGLSMVMCVDDWDSDPDDPVSQGGYPFLRNAIVRGQAESVLVDMPTPVILAGAWSLVHGFVALELTNHLTGGDTPWQTPEDPAEAMARRDAAFEGVLDTFLFGITRR